VTFGDKPGLFPYFPFEKMHLREKWCERLKATALDGRSEQSKRPVAIVGAKGIKHDFSGILAIAEIRADSMPGFQEMRQSFDKDVFADYRRGSERDFPAVME
jgi:hypothetical protein